MHDLFVFRSLTAARHAASVLASEGVRAAVVRKPAQLGRSGCGYGLQVDTARTAETSRVLRERGLGPFRVYPLQGGRGVVR